MLHYRTADTTFLLRMLTAQALHASKDRPYLHRLHHVGQQLCQSTLKTNRGLSPLARDHARRVVTNCKVSVTSAGAEGNDSGMPHAQLSLIVLHGDYVLLTRLAGNSSHTYGALQGIMEAGEQAQQAAVRIAEQQAGIALDESSIAPLQANPSVLHARTSKRDAAGHPTGLDLLQGKARECAIEVQLQAHEVDTVLGNPPPQLQLEKACAADARWFNKRWLLAHSKGSVPATALRLTPGDATQSPGAIQAWLEEAKSELSSALDQVPDVVIETGVFKYVLLVVTDLTQGRSKLIVRGDRQSGYHMDVYEKTVRELSPQKLHVAEPLGGGRIRHDDGSKAITIYGYSSAYGQPPHDLSAAIVRQWYPLYAADKITVSYEGY